MTIQEYGMKNGCVRYDLLNDDGGFIARFDGLEDAALVLRYINGADMDTHEVEHAVLAMQCAQVARTLGRTLNAARQAKRTAKGKNDDAFRRIERA